MAPSDSDKKSCGSKMQAFCHWIYNPEKKEIIGRTCGSWAKIGAFYIVFYACLAGFFAIMLVGFFSTLDSNAPTQKDMWSLIKANPGMGFRPMPVVESTLIRFNVDNPATYKIYVDNIKKFFTEFNNKTEDVDTVSCSEVASATATCAFNMTELGKECSEENDYGYAEGKPCVLLKANKVYNWKPVAFGNETTDDKKKLYADAKKALGDRLSTDHVGISCEGENDADVDNIGKSEYFPKLGYSFNYYPFLGQKGYKPPLVFVKFNNLKQGVAIQVWCKLWAENIKHHKNDKAGSTHFEILVDKKPVAK